MKLINKRNVFLSSLSRASGNTSDFSIQMPTDLGYNADLVYKMYISQANVRNSFFSITDANRQYYVVLHQTDSLFFPASEPSTFDGGFVIGLPGVDATPRPPDPTPVNPGQWSSFLLPKGCLTDFEIASAVNESLLQVFNGATAPLNIRCLVRFGRLHVCASDSTYSVSLFFGDGIGTGSAHRQLGFPQKGGYTITPAVVPDNDRVNVFDQASNIPPETSMSPTLINTGSITDIYITTSLPNNNYEVFNDFEKQDIGAAITQTTISIPVMCAPGGSIVYSDTTGVNAILHRAVDHFGLMHVKVQDKNKRTLVETEDWSMLVTVETYEDTPKQKLALLKQASEDDDQMLTVLKMMLLQNELPR